MHDWWLALVAAAFGEIGCIYKATMLYRQHGANAVGAKRSNNLLFSMKRLVDLNGVKQDMSALFLQASEFLERYRGDLATSDDSMLEAFVSVPSMALPRRLRIFCRYHIWKYGIIRKAGQLLISGR
jgi:hypothetical protein